MYAHFIDLISQVEEITGEQTNRQCTANDAVQDVSDRSPNADDARYVHHLNMTQNFGKSNDPMTDLTSAEQLVLNSILQGAKISKATHGVREDSKLRNKKKIRRRYRKITQLSGPIHGIDAYKEHHNDDKKLNLSSIKGINRQFKVHIQGKRNASKIELNNGHLSDGVRRKNFNAPVALPRNPDIEIKLKKYINILSG
jgi:hypothetical protein